MKELFVPRSDVNSEEFVIVEWRVADGRTVTAGEVIANIETQKSDIEVTAKASGVLVHAAEVGDTVRFEAPLAFVLRAAADIPAAKAALAERAASTLAAGDITASAAARALAERHGVDLGEVTATGMITSADVEAHVQLIRASNRPLGLPLSAPVGMQRLVLIGGGLGATQVLEILRSDPQRQAVAIIDDDATRWGDSSLGVPVVGTSKHLAELAEEELVDAAVITISTSISARQRRRHEARRQQLSVGLQLLRSPQHRG